LKVTFTHSLTLFAVDM